MRGGAEKHLLNAMQLAALRYREGPFPWRRSKES